MKSNRPIYIILVMAIIYMAACWWLAERMISHTNNSVNTKYHNAEVLNFEERLLSAKEWIFTKKEQEKKKLVSKENLKLAEQEYEKAHYYSFYIIMGSIGFFLIALLVYFGSNQFYKAMSLNLAAISLVCLYSGIYTPILEISAFNDDLVVPLKMEIKKVPVLKSIPWVGKQEIDLSKEFKGRMYYLYQCKPITGIIGLLFKDRNFVVGIAILCFSIIIPILKLILSVGVLLSNRARKINWLKAVVGEIGKWSMADVYVVAAFLSYLSFSNINSGVDTEANSMIGLYYFLAFVILSITSTMLMARAVKKEMNAT